MSNSFNLEVKNGKRITILYSTCMIIRYIYIGLNYRIYYVWLYDNIDVRHTKGYSTTKSCKGHIMYENTRICSTRILTLRWTRVIYIQGRSLKLTVVICNIKLKCKQHINKALILEHTCCNRLIMITRGNLRNIPNAL